MKNRDDESVDLLECEWCEKLFPEDEGKVLHVNLGQSELVCDSCAEYTKEKKARDSHNEK